MSALRIIRFSGRVTKTDNSGEYGMGTMANELSLGCDCLGQIHYLVSTIVIQKVVAYSMAYSPARS